MEEGQQLPGLWIGLPVVADNVDAPNAHAHVTIVIRHVVEEGDREQMEEALRERIAPMLPIVAILKPGIVMRGWKHDVPTMDVAFDDPAVEVAIGSIYAHFYKQVPGHTKHPTLQMHLTVDGPERLAVAHDILKNHHGVWVALTATLKEIGNNEVLARVP